MREEVVISLSPVPQQRSRHNAGLEQKPDTSCQHERQLPRQLKTDDSNTVKKVTKSSIRKGKEDKKVKFMRIQSPTVVDVDATFDSLNLNKPPRDSVRSEPDTSRLTKDAEHDRTRIHNCAAQGLGNVDLKQIKTIASIFSPKNSVERVSFGK